MRYIANRKGGVWIFFFRGKTLYYRLSKSSEYRKGMKITIKSDNLPQEEDVKRELRERFAVSRIAYAELNGKKVSHLSPLYSLSGQEDIDPQKKIEVRLGGGFLEVEDTGRGADESSLAFMFAACHVSKEQVPVKEEILCTHRPEDIGTKDRVCRVDLCRQGEVITGDESEGEGIRLYIECGCALELQENRENIHITEGLCQVLVSQCKRLLRRRDLPISFRCDAVKKVFLLIKSRSEQGVLYQNMVFNFAKKLKELLGDYASQLREVGGLVHSGLSVFIEREGVSFFPEELLTEEDRLLNLKVMKAKQIGVVHHVGGEKRDRPLYMVPSEKDIQNLQDMRTQVVDCSWGIFIPESRHLSRIFSKKKNLSLEEVKSIEFFLSSLISSVINTTYELDREEAHRYQVKCNDFGHQRQRAGAKGGEGGGGVHANVYDKDGEGEERYDEEGVDLILLEDRGERMPQNFLGHYVREKRSRNIVLARRFWDRPQYHLNKLWVSEDKKVCIYGPPEERVIAYVPSLEEKEREGFMGVKNIGFNFLKENYWNQSAYRFKERGKYAVVSHRHFVEKKGEVFYNYIFDDVVECLRDETQPELAVAIVRLGVDFYLISESDFYSTREEIESHYHPYRDIKLLSKQERVITLGELSSLRERAIGFAVTGTSSPLKAFVPFDWDFFKKNRKESPTYIYDDITDISLDGKLMIVKKNDEFYVVRADFSEDDLREHVRRQKGFVKVLTSNFIQGRGVILSIMEGKEEKLACLNMEGQCIWIEPCRIYIMGDDYVSFYERDENFRSKEYVCSLDTFFSQGFVRETVSFSSSTISGYVIVRVGDNWYIVRPSDRQLSEEDVMRKYAPLSLANLWSHGKIIEVKRDENGYQYVMRTEDYLALPQGSCGWKDRALKGHFLGGWSTHFISIREDRAEVHFFDDFLSREDFLEEGTRKVIFRDSPGLDLFFHNNREKKYRLEVEMDGVDWIPHEMRDEPFYNYVLERPLRKGICLRFDRIWSSVPRELRRDYLDVSHSPLGFDADSYYKACFSIDASKMAKEDMLRRKEKLYGLSWKTSPSKEEKIQVYISILEGEFDPQEGEISREDIILYGYNWRPEIRERYKELIHHIDEYCRFAYEYAIRLVFDVIGDKEEEVFERCQIIFENPVYRRDFLKKMEESKQNGGIEKYGKNQDIKHLGRCGDYFKFMLSDGIWIEVCDEECVVGEHRVYLGQVEEEFNRLKREGRGVEFSDIWKGLCLKKGKANERDGYIAYMMERQRHDGAYAGELFQNSHDGGAKQLTVRYYKNADYLIEECEDDGEGVDNLAYLLLLERSTKSGNGSVGNKGIGSLSVLSGIEQLEIDNVREGYREKLFLKKDENGMWYCHHYKKEKAKINEKSGLRYRRYLKSEIAELDVLRLCDNWKQQIGVSYSTLKWSLKTGNEIIAKPIEVEEIVLRNNDGIRLLKKKSEGQEMSGCVIVDRAGIFMRRLTWTEREKDVYFEWVPESLREVTLESGLVFVFEGELTRSRDRPKEEEDYLKDIQKKIYDAVLEYICQQLVSDCNFYCPRLPRDYFTNPQYDGDYSLHDPFLQELLNKEFVERGEGRITTLKKVRLEIEMGEGIRVSGLSSLLIEEREHREKMLEFSRVREEELSEDEKKTYMFFQSLISCFQGDLGCVIIENRGRKVPGFYKNNVVYIAREVLGQCLEMQLETLAHECAHYLEEVFFNGRECYGTHHNDGPFSLCYRFASWLFLGAFLKDEVIAMDEEEEGRRPQLKRKRAKRENLSEIDEVMAMEEEDPQLKRKRAKRENLSEIDEVMAMEEEDPQLKRKRTKRENLSEIDDAVMAMEEEGPQLKKVRLGGESLNISDVTLSA